MYPNMDNLNIIKKHKFIGDGEPIQLCQTGWALATKIYFNFCNKDSDDWKIKITLAKYYCCAMGSSGIDNSYPVIKKIISGTGYQSASEHLYSILTDYQIEKWYIQNIIQDLLDQQLNPDPLNRVINAGPMPLEFWKKVNEQNRPPSLEYLSWIKLEIEKFNKSI